VEVKARIESALISVYHKNGLDKIVRRLAELGVTIYSTGGTYTFLEELGIKAEKIEDLTSYPSILGGRVKTLHPKVFGGILGRRGNEQDLIDLDEYDIPTFDLIVVDLYPFEETSKSGALEDDIIEKIDIGGISLIRAAAKNFAYTVVIPSQEQYKELDEILTQYDGQTGFEQRKKLASQAFDISSRYDRLICDYLATDKDKVTEKTSLNTPLRYGENPHQKAWFQGNLDEIFTQLTGKELSYNNLVDIDAALGLVAEFKEPVCAIIKHTNPCGLGSGENALECWKKALAADPVSAFGGIIAFNIEIGPEAAIEIDKIFFEVCIAPGFSPEALELLSKKKNRMLLKLHQFKTGSNHSKSILNGLLNQDYDVKSETEKDFNFVSVAKPSQQEIKDLLFANKIVKHGKSNTILLTKDEQLIGIGVGQTSRVDALKQAIEKAKNFGFNTEGAVMASDAFFPFADCVEIAYNAGIRSVIHPGGSIRDQDSIDFCNKHEMTMVTTGFRHFRH
jgi:phosphoribosylaminoimidazolecarboxamide formyltransferase/IMP cyclohydrolase